MSGVALSLASAQLMRYSFELRVMLDLVHGELHRLGATRDSVTIVTPFEELEQDLRDRLSGMSETARPVTVYLLALEEMTGFPAWPEEPVIVAFRNRLSHKPLLYRSFKGLDYRRLETSLASARLRRYGIFGPHRLAQLALAGLLNRAGRFDYGFHVADRAVTSLVHQGPVRYICPYGVISAEPNLA